MFAMFCHGCTYFMFFSLCSLYLEEKKKSSLSSVKAYCHVLSNRVAAEVVNNIADRYRYELNA